MITLSAKTTSRRLGAALITAATAAGTLVLTAAPAAASITSVAPDTVTNTNTSQTLVIHSDRQIPHQAATTTVYLEGPGSGTDQYQGTVNSVSNGDISATFNLAPSSLPAGPGSYTVYVCDATPTCAPSPSPTTETSSVTVTGSAPVPTSLTPSSIANGQSDVPVKLAGTHFAKGDTVTFSSPNVTFTKNDPQGTDTEIDGKVSVAAGAGAGTVSCTVTNTAGGHNTLDSCLTIVSPPTITAITPDHVGSGAMGAVEQVTGSGFDSDAKVAVNENDGTTPSQITVTNVGASPTAVNFTINVPKTEPTGDKKVVITNDDNSSASVTLTVNPGPSITSVNAPARGQNSTGGTATINGSGFQQGANVSFSGTGVMLGGGSTVTVSGGGTTIMVTGITVAPDAAPGDRAVTVTNPDLGSATSNPSAPMMAFTVDPGPKPTSLSPSDIGRGDTRSFTLSGTDFDPSGATITAQTPGNNSTPPSNDSKVTFNVTSVSNDGKTISGTVTVDSDAGLGPRDLIVQNDDGGTATCAGCLNITDFDVTAVNPPSVVNSDSNVTIKVTAGHLTQGDHYTLTFSRNPVVDGQPPLVLHGTATQTNEFTSDSYDFTDEAAGHYDATLSDDDSAGHVGGCTGCFTITPAGSPTLTAINPNTIPANGSRQFTLTGTNLYRGGTVTLPDAAHITQTGITYTPATGKVTSVTVTLQASGATSGQSYDVTYSNATVSGPPQSSDKSTLPNGLTVTDSPTIDSVSPSTVAPGATVTVTGTHFQTGAKVTLTMGATTSNPIDTTGSGTSLTFVVPAGTAQGTYDVTVTNPDGGSATKPASLTVSNAPPAPTNLSVHATSPTTASGSFTASSGATGYDIVVSQDPTVTANDTGVVVHPGSTATSFTVTGLTAAAVYTVKVRAKSNSGNSAYATTKFATPHATKLTIKVSPSKIVAGKKFTISGNLVDETGHGVTGRKIGLSYTTTATPHTKHILASTTTTVFGKYSVKRAVPVNATITATFAGVAGSNNMTPGYAKSSATSKKVTVASHVIVHVKKLSGGKILVSGSVSPKQPKRTVTVYQDLANGKLIKLGTAKLTSASTYSLKTRPKTSGKKNQRIVVTIPKRSANAAGRSAVTKF